MKSGLLISTSTFPLRLNDATPRFVWDLARHLIPFFPEVHVLAPAAPGFPLREQWEKVFVHRFVYFLPKRWQLLCYRNGISTNLAKSPWLWFQAPFFLARQTAATSSVCQKNKVGYINSHWLVFQGLTAGLARRRTSLRHVCHVHAAELYALMRLPPSLGKLVAGIVVNKSDLVICESSHVKACLERLVGRPFPTQISCMGVDVSLFCEAVSNSNMQSAGRILFVGRLVEKKGVEHLIRAMPIVRSQWPDASLVIVGAGILESRLKALASELSLSEKAVQFAGPQPHHKLVDFLKKCDVFVVPSVIDSRGETEGMPTVLLEAMAAGRKVVASNVNGIPDVVKHGVNGWLVPPADPVKLACAIADALVCSDEKIPLAARKTAAFYNWPALAERYAGWLKGL